MCTLAIPPCLTTPRRSKGNQAHAATGHCTDQPAVHPGAGACCHAAYAGQRSGRAAKGGHSPLTSPKAASTMGLPESMADTLVQGAGGGLGVGRQDM